MGGRWATSPSKSDDTSEPGPSSMPPAARAHKPARRGRGRDTAKARKVSPSPGPTKAEDPEEDANTQRRCEAQRTRRSAAPGRRNLP
jgi:hypothetical protein